MARLAIEHELSAYDAAYVAGAAETGARLVRCDVRDLVSRGLAIVPVEAVALDHSEQAPGAPPPAP